MVEEIEGEKLRVNRRKNPEEQKSGYFAAAKLIGCHVKYTSLVTLSFCIKGFFLCQVVQLIKVECSGFFFSGSMYNQHSHPQALRFKYIM